MQENEFEKQVKDKMEELNFQPSAPVWEAIKKEIEKKKRRVLPFIFLLIGIAISGVYFIYIESNNNRKHTNVMILNKTEPLKNAQPLPEINEEKQHKQLNVIISKSEQQHQSLSTTQLNKLDKQLTTRQHKASKIFAYNNQSFKTGILRTFQKNNADTIKDYKHFPYQTPIKNNVDLSTDTFNKINAIVNTSITKQNDIVDSRENITTENKADSNNRKSIPDSSKKTNSIVKNDSSKQNKKTVIQIKKSNSKWQFGPVFMYGKSNLENKLFNADLSTSKPLSTAANPQTNVEEKQPYKYKAAYKFGFVFQRKISKNIYLGSGLNYVHLQTSSVTARSLDSSLVAFAPVPYNLNSATGYYRSGSEKTYNNHYNFVDLPISLQVNLFHIKSMALSFDAGVSVMRLISAKTILYNSKNNNYFNDSNLLRKTQFQLLSGLNFQLNTKKQGSFLLGPHIEYSLSTFLKNKDYNKLHYMNYGLQATWLFNKK